MLLRLLPKKSVFILKNLTAEQILHKPKSISVVSQPRNNNNIIGIVILFFRRIVLYIGIIMVPVIIYCIDRIIFINYSIVSSNTAN